MSINFEYLFLVYFIYGLAFFSLGLVLLLESWRILPGSPQVALIRPLAVFGLLHGIHEWFEIFIMQANQTGVQYPDIYVWIRLGLLACSFFALWVYSLQAFLFAREHLSPFTMFGIVTLPLFAILIALDVIIGFSQDRISAYQLTGSLVRYMLGVPGAALATLGLRAGALKARTDQRRPLDTYLLWAAFGFALYSVTQMFVPPMDTFLADLINTRNFQAWTGFPIQVVRTATAILITIEMFNAIHFLEIERQRIVSVAQQARLDSIQQQEMMRRDLLRHTVRAQEEERTRIARELHDEMAQILTAFSLELRTLENDLPKRAAAQDVLKRLQNLSRQLTQGVYGMVNDLRPAHLDDLGLIPALNAQLERESGGVHLNGKLIVEGEPCRVDPMIETLIFRIVQEALTNIARHAGVDSVTLRLQYKTSEIHLEVTDRGKGFDLQHQLNAPHGWGLAGMRERVESVNGEIDISSAPGLGTTIRVRIPCQTGEYSK